MTDFHRASESGRYRLTNAIRVLGDYAANVTLGVDHLRSGAESDEMIERWACLRSRVRVANIANMPAHFFPNWLPN